MKNILRSSSHDSFVVWKYDSWEVRGKTRKTMGAIFEVKGVPCYSEENINSLLIKKIAKRRFRVYKGVILVSVRSRLHSEIH